MHATAMGKIVKQYLEQVGSGAGGHSTTWYQNQIDRNLAALDNGELSPLKRMTLLQANRNHARKITALGGRDIQAEFIEIAAEYSASRGWEYATWREMGVPASVLKEAGVGPMTNGEMPQPTRAKKATKRAKKATKTRKRTTKKRAAKRTTKRRTRA